MSAPEQTPRGPRKRPLLDPLWGAPDGIHQEGARRRALIRLLLVLVVVVVAVAVAVGAMYVWHLESEISLGDTAESGLIQTQLGRANGSAYNLLIDGVDTASPGARKPSGALVLAHVDPDQNAVWLLWLPPKTQCVVNGYGTSDLADARVHGGPAELIRSVKQLTGLPINQYAEIDYPAIQRLVDSVGGIWVQVGSAIQDTAADTSPNHDSGLVAPGRQLLDGYHALTFFRAPVGLADFVGYGRMGDQQQLLHALAPALGTGTGTQTLLRDVSAVAPYLRTTMTLQDLADLRTTLLGAAPGHLYEATLLGTQTTQYLVPDSRMLGELVGDMREGTPFSVPAATLAAAARSVETVRASKPPKKTTVTVLNGGGISGAARQAAGVLQTQGFQIASTGNANVNVYPQTLVVYKTDPSLASSVAQYLMPGTKVVRSNGFYAFNTDVLVVVGKDWDLSKVPAARILTQ